MKKRSQFHARLLNSKFFVVGLIVSGIILFLAIIAPYIIYHDEEMPILANTLNPPEYFSKGWHGNILGADNLGRDILSRLLIGSRYSLFIAFATVFFASLLGIILGLISGYYGGYIDNFIMRFADIQLSIPALLLAIAIIAVLGPNIINLIIVLVILISLNLSALAQIRSATNFSSKLREKNPNKNHSNGERRTFY